MLTLEGKTLFIALLVGIAHMLAGFAILFGPPAALVTPFATLYDVFQYAGYSPLLVAPVLISAGFMAIIGSQMSAMNRGILAVMFAPQQVLLLFQIIAISHALVQGRYPDGYVPLGGAWFILADQSWAWILAVSHSVWLGTFLYGSHQRGNRGVH